MRRRIAGIVAAGGLMLIANAAAALPGDSNRDERVSAPDISALVRILAGAAGNEGADANLDGFILPDDLDATIARVFGGTPGEVTPTPAPTATITSTPRVSATPSATASGTRSATATETGLPLPSLTRTATATTSHTLLPSATHTLRATPTATQPAGSGAIAESVAGSAVVVANGMTAIPSIVTALVSGLEFGGAAGVDQGGAAGACPLGGTATRSCTTTTSMAITLAGCKVATASGSVTIDGTISVNASGGFCPLLFSPWNANIAVTAVFRDGSGGELLRAQATLTGTVDPQLGGSCNATGASLVLTGTTSTTFGSAASASVSFQNTSVGVAVTQFSAQCVPVDYALTFNGPATITNSTLGGSAASEPFAVTFGNFVVRQNATAVPTMLRMDGDITARCYGGTVTLQTITPLSQAVGQPCPTGGVIKVTAPAGMAQLLYLAGGVVGIDTNLDGVSDTTFPSCLDSALLVCLVQSLPTVTPSASRTATHTEDTTLTPTRTLTEEPSATVTGTATRTITGPLPPSATPTRTPSITLTPLVSPTPSATRTASSTQTATASPTLTATATPSATATATLAGVPALFCDTLSQPVALPDNNAAGITNDIVVSDPVAIGDLNVRLDVSHTFVGDLKATLTHVNTGTTVVLLDRPGLPASTDGCGRNDVSCLFDDLAERAGENQCLPSAAPIPDAAIAGNVKPFTPLSVFAGQSVAGTWRLSVSDNAAQDAGSLLGWCLDINSTVPVVTQFMCDGSDDCIIPFGEPFTLSFGFADPDGNASSWTMQAIRDDGQLFDVASGGFNSPSSGTIRVNFEPFTCTVSTCPEVEFDFVVVISDLDGHTSRATRVHITVPAS